MIQEYLLQDENIKKDISDYKPEKASIKLYQVEKGKCWYAKLSVNGSNEQTARDLSDIDMYVQEHFAVTVLRSDCSAYFTNKLYPLLSSFERTLRKLLYIFSVINNDDESAKNIKELENKTIGQIFTMLFIDDAFVRSIKESIKGANRDIFSKDDILKLISSVDEKTVWDSLMGDDIVPTLRKNFQEVRSIRNKVMHAHNINWNEYKNSRKLLRKIIKEMDTALDDVSIKESIATKKPSYNHTLSDALKAQVQIGQIASLLVPYIEGLGALQTTLKDSYKLSPAYISMTKEAAKLANMMASPEMTRITEQAQDISRMLSDIHGLKAAQEQARMLSEIYRNPAIIEAQRQAAQISNILNNNPGILAMQDQSRLLSEAAKSITLPLRDAIDDTEGSAEEGED
ncbi:MAG: hypothetical protein ACYCDV_08890 [Facklamia hominis]